MSTFDQLASWLQGQHLEPPAIAHYRECLRSHPARVVVMDDFLVEAVADPLAKFLINEGDFETQFGLFSHESAAVSPDEWRDASEEDRFFRVGKLVGVHPRHILSPNTLMYLRFRHAFQGSEMPYFFEQLSGLDLAASDDFGAFKMAAGDFLKSHDDDNRNRRLAIVIHLSPDWDVRDGGALHVVDAAGRDTTVEARFNTAVVFDVTAGSTHYVDPIEDSARDRARLTIQGWYHKPAPVGA